MKSLAMRFEEAGEPNVLACMEPLRQDDAAEEPVEAPQPPSLWRHILGVLEEAVGISPPPSHTKPPPWWHAALRDLWADVPVGAPVGELLPTRQDVERLGGPHHEWGLLMAIAWWTLAELEVLERRDAAITLDALDGHEDTLHVEGSLTVRSSVVLDQFLVVEGDLIVEGDVDIDYQAFYERFGDLDDSTPQVIVFGDLVVEGSLGFDGAVMLVGGDLVVGEAFDEESDWSLVVVVGSLMAERMIRSCGELFVGRVLGAPWISLTYNHGHTTVLGSIVAILFHESDHAGSWCASAPSAAVSIYGEMTYGTSRVCMRDDPVDVIRRDLERVLVAGVCDACFAGSRIDDGVMSDPAVTYFELDDVLYELSERVARGDEVFSAEARGDFENRVNAGG